MKKISKLSNILPQALPPLFCLCARGLSVGWAESLSSKASPQAPSPTAPRWSPPPTPLLTSVWAQGSGCAVQGWSLGWGVCGGEGGADRATAAQPQCHPAPPTWPPALPPAQPAGPRAGTTREKRKVFFPLLQKLFLALATGAPPLFPLAPHLPPISLLAVLKDKAG